jgi:hypothetical protein
MDNDKCCASGKGGILNGYWIELFSGDGRGQSGQVVKLITQFIMLMLRMCEAVCFSPDMA